MADRSSTAPYITFTTDARNRLGSVFRGILLAPMNPIGTDVLDLCYSPVRFQATTVVFDPFYRQRHNPRINVKAGRHRAIERDINPVSYLQVRCYLTLRMITKRAGLRTYQVIDRRLSPTWFPLTTPLICPTAYSVPDFVLFLEIIARAMPEGSHAFIDPFSGYIFAKHAYSVRNPSVQVACPKYGAISPEDQSGSTGLTRVLGAVITSTQPSNPQEALTCQMPSMPLCVASKAAPR